MYALTEFVARRVWVHPRCATRLSSRDPGIIFVTSTKMMHRMAEQRTPFQFAIDNSITRRDIALAVCDGIRPEQLTAKFGISDSTVRAYSTE